MTVPIVLAFTLRQGDFTLEIDQRLNAQSVVLFGPSGSGKTSILEAIAGMRRPVIGTIEIGGRVLCSTDERIWVPPRNRQIGYVPQDLLLFPHLNVRRNILYGAGRGRTTPIERVLQILEIADLLERRVGSLSGGERQRVAIARALMSSPRLLLLDEPLAAVDRPLRRRIVPSLQRVRDELGTPMIYVTHDVEESKALADRVIVLDRGRVTRSGEPSVLMAHEVGKEP